MVRPQFCPPIVPVPALGRMAAAISKPGAPEYRRVSRPPPRRAPVLQHPVDLRGARNFPRAMTGPALFDPLRLEGRAFAARRAARLRRPVSFPLARPGHVKRGDLPAKISSRARMSGRLATCRSCCPRRLGAADEILHARRRPRSRPMVAPRTLTMAVGPDHPHLSWSAPAPQRSPNANGANLWQAARCLWERSIACRPRPRRPGFSPDPFQPSAR